MTKHICIVFALSLAGCLFGSTTPMSPAQLTTAGTHHYASASREQVVQACETALATLGYRVTVADPANGVVKSAPAAMGSSATGGPGYANVTDDGLAWTIVVDAAADGSTVHATPRGFRNGTEVHASGMWVHEVMDAKFKDLWSEIDAAVKMPAPAPAAPSA